MSKKTKKTKDRQRKSSTRFFSNLNTSSNIEYGYAETNTKSKKFKWIFGGLVLAVFATGIAVPWSLSSCTAQLKKPISNNQIVWYYTNPTTGNVEKQTMSMGDWLAKVQAMKFDTTFLTKWQNAFNSAVIEQLYNEEREAFLKFKAEYQTTHNGEFNYSKFGYDLSKSANEIRDEQSKILQANKKQFQVTGGSNWLEQWLKELQSNSLYGPQNSNENATTSDIPQMEQKAIEYMKTQAIKQPALARFESASISTDLWTVSDLTVTNENEIKYTDNAGKEQTIAPNTVSFANYLTPKNTMRPNMLTTSNQTVLAVFETKSYIPQYRVPNTMLSSVLSSFYKTATISSATLGITPGSENGAAFSITTDVLKNLFKVTNIQSAGAPVNNFVPINQISSFQGASNTNTIGTSDYELSKTKDKYFIQALAGDVATETDTSKVLGSTTLKTIAELLTSSSSSDSSSNSSSSSDSSSDSSSTDITANFNIAALGSLGSKYSTTNSANYQLYEAKDLNPITTFLELLFSITSAGDVAPDFTKYSWMKTNWDNIVGTIRVSQNLWSFIDLLKQNFQLDQGVLTFKGTNNQDFNTTLASRVDNLSESDLNYLGSLLTVVFTDQNAKSNYITTNSPVQSLGYWTLYKLSNSTYMYVATDSIKVFSVSINASSQINNFNQMIASDLYQTVNNTSTDSGASLYYNVASMYSKLNDDYIINSILLSDDELSNRFKFKISQELSIEVVSNAQVITDYDLLPTSWFTTLLTSEQQTQVNDVYTKFVNEIQTKVSSTLATANKNAFSNVESIIKTIADSGRSYDFALTKENDISNIIWQTPTKYSSSATYQGIAAIQEAFLNIIRNIVYVDSPTTKKGANK